jgi:type IV secretion system protein VirD4
MYRHGSLTNRCLFIADEAKTLGKSVQMEMARDAGREAGINMLLAFQSVHQVREVWEKGAGSWFASASWVSFSCIAEIETAELVAKLCGKRGVLAYSEGLNSGTSSGQNRSRSSGYQTNAHEISRDLIQPAEVIHKLRTDEQIVIAPGCNPMRMSRSIAFRRPEMDTKIKETP